MSSCVFFLGGGKRGLHADCPLRSIPSTTLFLDGVGYLFFVNSPEVTGKSFIYSANLANDCSQGILPLAIASGEVVSTLGPVGVQCTHS